MFANVCPTFASNSSNVCVHTVNASSGHRHVPPVAPCQWPPVGARPARRRCQPVPPVGPGALPLAHGTTPHTVLYCSSTCCGCGRCWAKVAGGCHTASMCLFIVLLSTAVTSHTRGCLQCLKCLTPAVFANTCLLSDWRVYTSSGARLERWAPSRYRCAVGGLCAQGRSVGGGT